MAKCDTCHKMGHKTYAHDYVPGNQATFDASKPFTTEGSLPGGARGKRKRKIKAQISVIINNYADMKKGNFQTQEEGKEIQNLQIEAEGTIVYAQYTKAGRKVRTKLTG